MRITLLGAVVIALASSAMARVAGQVPASSTPAAPTAPITPHKPLTLGGCPRQTPDARLNPIGFQETVLEYRRNLRLDRDLSLLNHRLRIAGGFWPTTGVAAQAGAIDPTRSAMAAARGIGGLEAWPADEVRVKNLERPLRLCQGS